MEHFFDTREEASIAAANYISKAVARRLDLQPEASLVVSGGTSPVRCLQELSATDINWQNVHVLLSDERWVASDSEDSNEKLIRDNLLQGKAAEARLHPMHSDSFSLEERCELFEETIRTLPFPFACSLIGMGEDGHFASLFPDAENLDEGLNVDSLHFCLPTRTAASPHARLTLTLAALSRSDRVVLLIFGDTKREIYEKAKEKSNGFPVSKLLLQKRAPVRVFWAP